MLKHRCVAVCLLCTHSAKLQGIPFDVLGFWLGCETKQVTGRGLLAQLAIRVLSIVANSAEIERLWSRMGLIHTKIRNRLGKLKVENTAVVKLDIQRDHVEHGRLRPRLKRKMGHDNEPEQAPTTSTSPLAHEKPDELDDTLQTETGTELAGRLERDLDEDEDFDIPEDTPPAAPTASPVRRLIVYFGTQRTIPLADLFDYTKPTTSPTTVGLNVFWTAAKTNLRKELEYYDLLGVLTDEEAPAPPAGENLGSAQLPITLD